MPPLVPRARLAGSRPPDADLLARFLEEEDATPSLDPPADLTPMSWRILEALGEPVGTGSLPVAFAHADLRGTSGWRAQIDAAERLTRTGVMQPGRLAGIYTQRRAAASGGVWDRVRAVQALDDALGTAESGAIGTALLRAWPLFEQVDLDRAFARIFAEPLAPHDLTGSAATLQWKILLLAETRLDRAAQIAPRYQHGPIGHGTGNGRKLARNGPARSWSGHHGGVYRGPASATAKPVAGGQSARALAAGRAGADRHGHAGRHACGRARA